MREGVLEAVILKLSIDEIEVRLGREWLPAPDKKNGIRKSSNGQRKYTESEELSVNVTLSGQSVM